MDCHSFRDNHLAWLDGVMPDEEMVAMRTHAESCGECGHHDAAVRRGLMLCRSLPAIQPSADFGARLRARLEAARIAANAPRFRGPSAALFAASALGVVVVGFAAAAVVEHALPPREVTLAPVVASRPAPTPSPLASPAMVVAASSGVAVWPVALVAEQAPVHFARREFRQANLTR
jgi:Putative zinc-finger